MILIVEDNADVREAIKWLLEAHDYSVSVAVGGTDALNQLRQGLRPQLILLDLRMPEKNGFQFRIEQLLDPMIAEIPVAVYSGDPVAHADSAILGAVAYLRKPLDMDKLLEVVRTHC